ncbi:MAG: YedE-related selenium metabolism membrane protein [Schwartzia sp.]|nr:YedE-related selenium metabolism membrane protein [Schwartzia sp. (in: firmicutes)]
MNLLIIIAGVTVGIAAVVLTMLGNPANMGFCIACFLRDIAGACRLHQAAVVQYVRPEIVGIVLGSTVMSLFSREFKARAGSSPAVRFVLGACVMIGALVFLGCPLRMVIRMGGGDLNAFVGFVGFAVGILIGIFFLRRGFSLKRSYNAATAEGFALPGFMVLLFIVFLIAPALFAMSSAGPGSKHAPVVIAFVIALAVGALAQKSRLCMVGGMRDVVMFRDFTLLSGFIAVFITVLAGNILLGSFRGFSTYLQPIAHGAQLWNLLGMTAVGWGSVLLGGCPLRQLILAGEGNGDSAVTVFGMIAGAAVAHNFKLAGGAAALKDGVYSVGGIGLNGQIALTVIFGILLLVSVMNLPKEK